MEMIRNSRSKGFLSSNVSKGPRGARGAKGCSRGFWGLGGTKGTKEMRGRREIRGVKRKGSNKMRRKGRGRRRIPKWGRKIVNWKGRLKIFGECLGLNTVPLIQLLDRLSHRKLLKSLEV